MSKAHTYRGRPVQVGDKLYGRVYGEGDYKECKATILVTGFTPTGITRIEIRNQQGEVISSGLAGKTGYYTHQRGEDLFINGMVVKKNNSEMLAKELVRLGQELMSLRDSEDIDCTALYSVEGLVGKLRSNIEQLSEK